jgi:hypothetical protein
MRFAKKKLAADAVRKIVGQARGYEGNRVYQNLSEEAA